VIYTGGLGIVQTFDWIVAAIVADDGFQATILVFTLLLGSGVAMVWNLGGTYAIRDWAIERLDTQRKAGLAAWVLGVILFFDDYANTAIVGSAMKDVSDQLRISREKLSYIVDSTAAPVATLGISSWVAFQLSLIEEGTRRQASPRRTGPAPSRCSCLRSRSTCTRSSRSRWSPSWCCGVATTGRC